MYRANNIYNEPVFEPACGLSTESAEPDTERIPGRPCKQDGTCQLISASEVDREKTRQPGKRNGCIGKWMNQPLNEALNQSPDLCHRNKQ